MLWTLLIGLIVGLVARALMPGNNRTGIIMTTILGIVGAFVGTYLGQWLGWYQVGETAGFIASVVGAMIVLLFAKLLVK